MVVATIVVNKVIWHVLVQILQTILGRRQELVGALAVAVLEASRHVVDILEALALRHVSSAAYLTTILGTARPKQ